MLRALWQSLRQGPSIWRAYRETQRMEEEVKKQLMSIAMENHKLLKDPKKSTTIMADNELKQIEEVMSMYVSSAARQQQQNPVEDMDKLANAKQVNEVVNELLKEHKAGKQPKEVDSLVEQIKKSDQELQSCREELDSHVLSLKEKTAEDFQKLKQSSARLFSSETVVDKALADEPVEVALQRIERAKKALPEMSLGNTSSSLQKLLDEGERALKEIAVQKEKDKMQQGEWEHLSKEEAEELQALIAETSESFVKIADMKAKLAVENAARQVDLKTRLLQAKEQAQAQAKADMARMQQASTENKQEAAVAPMRALADVFQAMVADGAEVEGSVLSEDDRQRYHGIGTVLKEMTAEEFSGLEDKLAESLDVGNANPVELLKGMGDILIEQGRLQRQ